jgi:tetratricopeptide (TPR) repeat protein
MAPPAGTHPLVDRDHPLLREAITLWNKAAFEQSLWTYERALAAEPRNARIVINAARAYLRRNRPGKGLELLGTLTTLAPADPRVHHMVGETERLCSLPARAITSFETARRLGDATAKAALELAALYEQAGRLADAAALVDGVLDADPASLWAGLLRAQLHRRGGKLDDARRTLESLIPRADPRTELASQAWAELATVHDAAGDPDAAAAAIARCKAPQLASDGPAWNAAQHVARRFGELVSSLDAARIAAWNARAAMDVPSPVAILAGFPRSGTTLLEQILNAHPAVRSIEERDVLAGEIFPTCVHGHPPESPIVPIIDRLARKQVARLRERYVTALAEWAAASGAPAPNGTLLLDKNPGATPLIPVLRALFSKAPVLIALRDPRDVVLSCYMRYLQLNPLSANFLTVERSAAKYAMDMGAWIRFRDLSPEGWTEVKYEDLVGDIEGVARRAIGTLGVAWDDAVLAYRARLEHKIVTSPTYDKVREPVTAKAVGRWKRYEKLLAPAMPHLQAFIKTFGYE